MFKKRLMLLVCVLGMLLSMFSCAGTPENKKPNDKDEAPVSEKEESPDVDEPSESEEPEEQQQEPTAPEDSKPQEDEPVDDEPAEEEPADEEPEPNNNAEPSQKPEQNQSDSGEQSNGATASNWSSADLTADEIKELLNDPYMILVNRQNKITSDFQPMDMTTYAGYKLNRTCADALKRMINAGKNEGYNFVLYSGYRTYDTQYNKYYNKIAYYKKQGYSEEKAIELTDQYYAQPGASEHHTGLAADVCIPRIVNKYGCLHENYDQTPEFKWFSAHAHEYGFILRYGKTQKSITGYNYEPWHYRYVGVDVASEIYRRGITYEEFIWELEDRLK